MSSLRASVSLWFLTYISILLLFSPLAFAQTQITQVTWASVGPSGSTDRIVALVVDPRSDSVFYAAAPAGGVWKTQNGGSSWSPLLDSQTSLQVCSFAIDPRFPDVIYAGTGDGQSPRPLQGVLRSGDGGLNWTTGARITDRPVCALAVDPTNSSRIFAGSEEGLFLSTDSGTSWTPVLTSAVTSIAFGSPGIVYAGMLGDVSASGARQHTLARSSDGGRTWTDVPLQSNSSTSGTMANWVTVVTNGNTVFVAVAYPSGPASQLDFYSSTDGSQWTATFGIGQARPPVALAQDLSGKLYLTGTNLLTSLDGGLTWAIVPTRGTDFHAATFIGGVLHVAGEKGFEVVPAGARQVAPIPVVQLLGVSIDPASRIWAGGPAGLFGLYPSSPFARTGVPGVGAVGRVAAVTTVNSTNIFAAGADKVHQSTDGGVQFSSQTVIPPTELRAPYPPLVVDPVVASSAFVAGRRVYHTTDAGATWNTLNVVDPDSTRVVTTLAMAPNARQTLFAATACLPEVALISCPEISVIWRSTNAGQTWTQMSVVGGFVNRFAIDPRQGGRVYAAIGAYPAGPSAPAGLVAGDLLLSTNNGAVWTSLLGNLPRTAINAVLIDPTSLPALFTQPAQTIYVGTDAGVFVSFDAGARWMDITAGLPASPITDLALLQPGGILVAATFGRGVYRAPVAGLAAGVIVQPLSQDVPITRGTSANIGVVVNNLSTTSNTDWVLEALDSWLSIPQSTGSLRPQGLSEVPVYVSAANLQMGTHIGRLQLTSTFGVQTVVVVAHVTPSPAEMSITSGNDASGLPGSSLPPLQVLVLDDNHAPLADVPVVFTITAGGGTLNVREVTTNLDGLASVILTLPAKPGAVKVVASTGTLFVTFTATALAAPTLLTDSIFNGVTFNANTSFGPGSILAIYGENLASGQDAATNVLPSSLVTTRVLITTPAGDVPLPLFSVSPLEIIALLPLDVSPGRYLLRAEVGTLRSNNVEISVAAIDPGIFTVNGSGRGPGIFVKSDGTIVSAANAADRGSTVSFFAAGLGPVNPPIESGQPGASSEPLNRTIQAPRVFFDRFSANVLYSGLAPGIPGRYLVTVQVPALVSPATNVSVSMTIGGFTSNRVTISIR